jgi:TDG/mug DNA glycosylase family protein
VRPTRDDLEAARGRTVPDLLPGRLRLLFVGINPGLWTAAVGAHFARPGNRFYPALHRAGITRFLLAPAEGYSAAELAELDERGVGITNLCPRATARADEVSREELRTGAEHLRRIVAERRPRVVAVLGITAYRQAFGHRDAVVGQQPDRWDGARLFVLPNPSGLNARASLDDLATAYGEAGAAAGIPGVSSGRTPRGAAPASPAPPPA